MHPGHFYASEYDPWVPVSLLPTLAGIAGHAYFFGALLLGVAFLAVGIAFGLRETRAGARRVLLASLAYLPLLFLLMLLDSTSASVRNW